VIGSLPPGWHVGWHFPRLSGRQQPGGHFKNHWTSDSLLPPARDPGKHHQLKTGAVDDPSGEDRGCKFRHEKKPHHKKNGSNTDGEAPSGLQVDHPPLIQDLPATEVAQAGHATRLMAERKRRRLEFVMTANEWSIAILGGAFSSATRCETFS